VRGEKLFGPRKAIGQIDHFFDAAAFCDCRESIIWGEAIFFLSVFGCLSVGCSRRGYRTFTVRLLHRDLST